MMSALPEVQAGMGKELGERAVLVAGDDDVGGARSAGGDWEGTGEESVILVGQSFFWVVTMKSAEVMGGEEAGKDLHPAGAF